MRYRDRLTPSLFDDDPSGRGDGSGGMSRVTKKKMGEWDRKMQAMRGLSDQEARDEHRRSVEWHKRHAERARQRLTR